MYGLADLLLVFVIYVYFSELTLIYIGKRYALFFYKKMTFKYVVSSISWCQLPETNMIRPYACKYVFF